MNEIGRMNVRLVFEFWAGGIAAGLAARQTPVGYQHDRGRCA
jgi:hypothetical protein